MVPTSVLSCADCQEGRLGQERVSLDCLGPELGSGAGCAGRCDTEHAEQAE